MTGNLDQVTLGIIAYVESLGDVRKEGCGGQFGIRGEEIRKLRDRKVLSSH